MLCPVLSPLVQGRPAPYRSPVQYRRVLAHSWKRGCIPRPPSRRVWRSFLFHPPFPLHQQFRSCFLTSCSPSTALERPFRPPVRFLQFCALPVSPSWPSRVLLTSALLDRSAPVLDSASAVPSLRSKQQSQCRRGNYSLASTFLPYSRCRASALDQNSTRPNEPLQAAFVPWHPHASGRWLQPTKAHVEGDTKSAAR